MSIVYEARNGGEMSYGGNMVRQYSIHEIGKEGSDAMGRWKSERGGHGGWGRVGRKISNCV